MALGGASPNDSDPGPTELASRPLLAPFPTLSHPSLPLPVNHSSLGVAGPRAGCPQGLWKYGVSETRLGLLIGVGRSMWVHSGSPRSRKLTLSCEWLQQEGGPRQRLLQRLSMENSYRISRRLDWVAGVRGCPENTFLRKENFNWDGQKVKPDEVSKRFLDRGNGCARTLRWKGG